MNRDRIIELAKQADHTGENYPEFLERFAALIEAKTVAEYEAAGSEPVAWRFLDDEEAGYITYQGKPPTPEQVDYLAKWNRPAWGPLFTSDQLAKAYAAGKRDAVPEFIYAFKRHVGGDGEFWLHELEDFAAAPKGETE